VPFTGTNRIEPVASGWPSTRTVPETEGSDGEHPSHRNNKHPRNSNKAAVNTPTFFAFMKVASFFLSERTPHWFGYRAAED
jgi:hypothetical protein